MTYGTIKRLTAGIAVMAALLCTNCGDKSTGGGGGGGGVLNQLPMSLII
jgi:hypothetical protein